MLVGHLEPERRRVLEVPRGRLARPRGARPGRSLVDLVVDVGDVVDVRDVVAALAQPVAQPGEDDERAPRCRCAPAGTRSGRRRTSRPSPAGREARRATSSRCRRGARSSRCYSGGSPPERLVAGDRGDDRPQLRAALGAGQREPEQLEVPADRLELAHDRARFRLVELLGQRARGARRTARASAAPRRRARRLRGSRICRAISRASTSVRAPRSARASSSGASAAAARSASGIPAIASIASRWMRREVEVDVVSRQPELVEVGAHRRGGNALVAQVGRPTRARRAWRASCRRRRAAARGGSPPAARRRAPGRCAAAPPRSAGGRSRG